MKPVLAEADVVGRVGEELPVVGHRQLGDRHEALAAGHLVQVEHHLLGRFEALRRGALRPPDPPALLRQ